eukprot:gene16488-34387_t
MELHLQITTTSLSLRMLMQATIDILMSSKIKLVTLSFTESEYGAISEASQEFTNRSLQEL